MYLVNRTTNLILELLIFDSYQHQKKYIFLTFAELRSAKICRPGRLIGRHCRMLISFSRAIPLGHIQGGVVVYELGIVYKLALRVVIITSENAGLLISNR